jgi:Ala-tRNA(Pro) deacylase
MTIAPTLQKYMDERGLRYDLVPHEPTLSALGSAHAGHI